MGYVVAARHIELGHLVAIKFLAKGVLSPGGESIDGTASGHDPEALARFRREARITARLETEHIAKVQDVGLHDTDEPFIVMEYLEGVDLGELSRDRGALPVAEACEFVLQACEALAEAHAAGIVHRDVKLANLFLTTTPAGGPLLKVLDFGVSKISDGTAHGEVTRRDMMVGSPKFMSPEQMKDPRNVDARTDVWALGVVLYRLVSGEPPFDGDTLAHLCTMVLMKSPPPLSTLRPDLPMGFEEVVAYCLVKDRTHRYGDVASLAAALAPFTNDVSRATERARRMAAILGNHLPGAVAHHVAYDSFPPAVIPLEHVQAAGGSSRISLPMSWAPTSEHLIGASSAGRRRRGSAAMLLAAAGVVMMLAGVAVFRVSASNAVAASGRGGDATFPPPAPLPPPGIVTIAEAPATPVAAAPTTTASPPNAAHAAPVIAASKPAAVRPLRKLSPRAPGRPSPSF